MQGHTEVITEPGLEPWGSDSTARPSNHHIAADPRVFQPPGKKDIKQDKQ